VPKLLTKLLTGQFLNCHKVENPVDNYLERWKKRPKTPSFAPNPYLLWLCLVDIYSWPKMAVFTVFTGIFAYQSDRKKQMYHAAPNRFGQLCPGCIKFKKP